MAAFTNLQQRLLPLADKPVGTLLIHEIYRSIQGESSFAGLPCVFIRTAVCDARCVWCDTPHAFNQGTVISLDDIFSKVIWFQTPLVEVTGGEPLIQPETLPLMARLADRGLKVLLETSGAHDISKVDARVHIIMDLKCPESGECPNNRWSNLEFLKSTDEIKFVIASRQDFDWAAEKIRQHNLDQRFTVLLSSVPSFLIPLDLANWLLESGLQVRLQIQLHKVIWDPTARGV